MRLKELRKERGLTQTEIAEGIGTGQSNIRRWEVGEVLPSSEFVIRLADFFEVSADYLLGRSDDFGNVSVQTVAPALTEEETEILTAFRAMTHSQRIRLVAYAEGMLENSTKKKA